jgi:hypothetical protein
VSAEVVNAFEAEAHRLDAEADNASDGGVRGEVQREIAQVLRNLALRSQGTDPAQAAAAEQAAQDSGAGQSGLAVERTDEAGHPVQPDAQGNPGMP